MTSAPLLPVEEAAKGLPSLERVTWQAISSGLEAGSGSVVTFTAPEAGAGTTVIAASTGASLARHLQLRVALVEANLQRPFLATACGVDARPGLSEVLLGAVPLEEAVQVPGALPGLSVLTAGAPREVAPGEFAGQAFADVLAHLSRTHDAVLVDAPPALEEPGTLALLRASGSAVLVTRARVSERQGVEEARVLVESAGARLLGAVLNRWRPELARGIG